MLASKKYPIWKDNPIRWILLLTLNLYLYIAYAPSATTANTTRSTQTAAHVAFASLALLPVQYIKEYI